MLRVAELPIIPSTLTGLTNSNKSFLFALYPWGEITPPSPTKQIKFKSCFFAQSAAPDKITDWKGSKRPSSKNPIVKRFFESGHLSESIKKLKEIVIQNDGELKDLCRILKETNNSKIRKAIKLFEEGVDKGTVVKWLDIAYTVVKELERIREAREKESNK